MTKKTVLVVEDDAAIREPVVEVLESEGYDVKAAANGQEALDMLLAGLKPNCIILDFLMPVMSGKEFVETVAKKHPELLSIPILLTSAKDRGKEELGVEHPKLEELRKPMDIERLLEMVAKHCS